MLGEKNGSGNGMKLGKSATLWIMILSPWPFDSVTFWPLARACWSANVSVNPVVMFSVLALNWMAKTELKIGDEGPAGFGIVVPGAGPGRPTSPTPIATYRIRPRMTRRA